jgi:hypothetical protein
MTSEMYSSLQVYIHVHKIHVYELHAHKVLAREIYAP